MKDAGLAIITGASAGIGAAFARQLSREGWSVALVARRADRLEALATELRTAHSIEALPIEADLSDEGAVRHVLRQIGARPVSLLVNNAGFTIPERYADTDWEGQRALLMTMVMAVAELTHAVLPSMIARRRGRIITVSSILALSQGGPGHTLYPAVKSFAHKFMLSLDAEVRGQGIQCTSVLPGSTASEFRAASGIGQVGGLGDAFVSSPDSVARAALAGNAAGRLIVIPGLPNQIAALAMKLAPDALIRWAGRLS